MLHLKSFKHCASFSILGSVPAFSYPKERCYMRKQGLKICIVVVFVLLLANAFGPAPAFATSLPAQPSAAQLENWRTAMAQVPLPKQGCFTATYPATQWQEIACVTPPNIPMPPKRQPRPLNIGNGADVSAQAPSGLISSSTGSFDAGTTVPSEAGQIGGSGGQVTNAYTLQLNTNFFSSVDCAGSPNPGCRGWEQFVYENDGNTGFHGAYIQYWLLQYNTTCPAGWNQFSFMGSTDIYCWRNSTGSASTPNQPATGLNNNTLTGNVAAGSDGVVFTSGGTMFTSAGNNFVHAAAGWTIAEFNVFGDGGGGQANFAGGTTMIPRTKIIYGGTTAPNCVAQGFTGETNNLNFGPGAPASTPPGPAVFFNQTNAGGALTSCSASTSVGDTHLDTFKSLLYDFQAAGDFVLAQTPDFVVHARQVSGAPTWPDADVNLAVATRIGGNDIAICPTHDGPALNVNGQFMQMVNNQPLSLTGSNGDGVDIWLENNNTYTILDQDGNALRAAINFSPLYINVSVGVGTQPETVTGLLANANDNVLQIAARDGNVLTAPFVFAALYGNYGTGWRVPPLQDTLLSACGSITENGTASKPFYASDLNPTLRASALQICQSAGVKDPALLDACTLDVAVLGTETAATVYISMPPPAAVGKIYVPIPYYLPLITSP